MDNRTYLKHNLWKEVAELLLKGVSYSNFPGEVKERLLNRYQNLVKFFNEKLKKLPGEKKAYNFYGDEKEKLFELFVLSAFLNQCIILVI